MEDRRWSPLVIAGLAPPSGAFSHGVTMGVGSGITCVCTSGITARRSDGSVVGEGDIEAQTRQVLSNLADVLSGAGCTLTDVAKLTVFVTDMNGFESIHRVRREFFSMPYPASTMVEVSRLVDNRLMIEIEAVAVRAVQG